MIFLGYPEEIRKIIYTTNAVESVNSQLQKVTKNKRVFQMIMLFLKACI
ncbi:transposase [Rickettsia endosymbiont of Cantharis rufa]